MHDIEGQVGRYIVRISEGFVVTLALLAAVAVHPYLVGTVPLFKPLAARSDWFFAIGLVAPCWVFTVVRTAADDVFVQLPSLGRIVATTVRLGVYSTVVWVSMLWFAKVQVNRGVIAVHFCIATVAVAVLRCSYVAWGRRRNQAGQGRNKVLVVGGKATSIARQLQASANPPSLVPPPLDDDEPWASKLESILHARAVDRVVFTEPYTTINNSRELIGICEQRGIPAVFDVPEDEQGERRARAVLFHGRVQIVYDQARERSFSLAVKQMVDTMGSAIGVVVLAPLLLVIACCLLLWEGGPVVFSQERVGLRGRRFRMYKFRTMVPNAEKMQRALECQNTTEGAAFKMNNDPRVTRLGRLLRRTSLDELPQLFNVLAGDMSLVGPRPLPSCEQQRIQGASRRRLAMKPGITGLWQVGGRSDTKFGEWMTLDLQYVDSWSLFLDVRILLRTVPAVLFGSGAR